MAITQRGAPLYAADSATGDMFGQSAAVSDTGAVLVVGAPFRNDGALTQSGGVYVYDWSGSAWVARGSVLTTSEDYARFGFGVALSADGLVLAVGAPDAAHGAYMGIVYIYDWSGSAWVLRGTVSGNTANNIDYAKVIALSGNGLVLAVNDYYNSGFYIYDWNSGSSSWVQRGSLLTSPNYYAIGGDSVALSYDGAILAAGITSYTSGGLNARGAVAIYDYAASVWTERAALVLASDAVAGDFLGASVALNSAGTSLCAGAWGFDGGGGNNGKAYRFTYSAGAWTQADTFLASDGATSDQFGAGIALSSNGLVAVVGATGWEGSVTDMGAVYTFDSVGVPLDGAAAAVATAAASLTGGHVLVPLAGAAAAVATAAASLTSGALVVAYTLLTVANPTGVIVAPTALTVTATGTLSAPTLLAVIDSASAIPGAANTWTARCLIDGIDVSSRLVGTASVPAYEGAARIASITLLPASGVIAPLDYVGKPITLDYVVVLAGVEVPRRLFTGRVDTPEYDLASTLLHLSCVDDLQNRVASLARSVIDGLIGGRYTRAVQGDILDNWDYAMARLGTVAASLDAGPHGGMRVTPWQLASSWATYGAGDLLYQQSQLTLPQRSTLINHVDVAFSYRYPRLRQRYTSMGWSGTNIDMTPCGYAYPKQQDILGAGNGTGWKVTLGIFYPAPAAIPHSSGGFIHPAAGSIDMAILYLTQRHSQTVTESYTLPVFAPESVAANGTLPFALRGALESSFDGNAWESALDVAPLMPSGGEQDYAPDAPRVDADYAIQTLLDQANVKILGSHRGARVKNAVLCNPDLDLDKRVTIATSDMAVTGKVASVTHVLDFASGSAITEFEIACFGAGGAGIITPTTLAPPAPPAAAVETQAWAPGIPPLHVNTFGVTPYNENLMGLFLNPPENIYVDDIPSIGSKSFPNPYYVAGSYPVTGFRVQMPGVDDADRNPLDKPVAGSYQIVIPSDTLTFTIP